MKKQTFFFALLVIICYNQLFAQCSNSLAVPENCTFTPIGHRGLSHLYPENSLLSLEQAFRHGVKYCEVDVSLTADGTYVLFHDAYALHRTTFAQGRIDDISSSEAIRLDNGSYKDTIFSFTSIPTLVEALKVAEKYDATLYLDTKDYSAIALKAALEESGIAPNRLAPSLESVAQAEEFRSVLPNSPWVWYGGGTLPLDVDDSNFYLECINLGCIAFEVSFLEVGTSPEWFEFESQVHGAGSKIWAFTVNDPLQAQSLISLGIDGLESDRPVALARTICQERNALYPDSLTTGNWRFKSSLADTKGIGSQFRTRNYSNPNPNQIPTFGSCSSFGIPGIASSSDSVMLIPAQSPEDGILVYTNFSVDDDGAEDFTYTFMLDFLIPETADGKWISIYQTSTSNGNDAELFINPEGEIGIIGDYFGETEPDTWYRLVVAYDGKNQLLHLFLNGEPLGTIETFTNRWAVFNSAPPGENQGFLLFSDNDSETADVFVSAFQVRDYAMSEEEVALLGSTDIQGFPSHNADLFLVNSPLFYPDSVFFDYDLQQYTCVIQPQHDLNNVPINFSLVSGASSSTPNGSFFDFSSNTNTITVTSADNTVSKAWEICVRKPQGVRIEEKQALLINVYPNPVRDNIYLTLPHASRWTLFTLMSTNIKTGSEQIIDISNLPNGPYILTIQSNDQLLNRTVIVNH